MKTCDEGHRLLRWLGACVESIKWIDTQPDMKGAWYNCHRGDWLVWIAQKIGATPTSLEKATYAVLAHAMSVAPHTSQHNWDELAQIYTSQPGKRPVPDARIRGAIWSLESYVHKVNMPSLAFAVQCAADHVEPNIKKADFIRDAAQLVRNHISFDEDIAVHLAHAIAKM